MKLKYLLITIFVSIITYALAGDSEQKHNNSYLYCYLCTNKNQKPLFSSLKTKVSIFTIRLCKYYTTL